MQCSDIGTVELDISAYSGITVLRLSRCKYIPISNFVCAIGERTIIPLALAQ
jgi:hypothetical protein